MSNYAVICPIEGMEQMAQLQWTVALRKLGHHVEVHNLRSANEDPRAGLAKLVSRVTRNSPETIFVEGAIGFNLPEFYLHPAIQSTPVAAFWFDAPIRPVDYRKNENGYLEALRLPNVHHFVWDGYWRRWLLQQYQIRSFPIHLAANSDQFHPLPHPAKYLDHAVFIGAMVSLQQIEEQKQKLPSVLKHMASAAADSVNKSPYGANPFDIIENTLRGLPSKMTSAYEQLRENQPEEILHFRSLVWMLAKNDVRKRVLKEVLKVTPLLMLCGNLEQTHAGEREVRELLDTDSNRLTVLDTRDKEASGLNGLYAYGKIHLQATDPQSVEGGIPFRVFQTTAARRPLLTDKKPELAQCYCYDDELLTFNSEKDFADCLQKALSSKERLDTVAANGYRRFLMDHTWEKRFQYVIKTVFGSNHHV